MAEWIPYAAKEAKLNREHQAKTGRVPQTPEEEAMARLD